MLILIAFELSSCVLQKLGEIVAHFIVSLKALSDITCKIPIAFKGVETGCIKGSKRMCERFGGRKNTITHSLDLNSFERNVHQGTAVMGV